MMVFVFHIHTSPACETTHHRACASVDGSEWEQRCFSDCIGTEQREVRLCA